MTFVPREISPKSAFGEVLVAQNVPAVYLNFQYNINTDIVGTTLVGSGTVTQSGNHAVVSTGAASSSSAILKSLKKIHYFPGQGVDVRFTAVFTAGVAGSEQTVGIGTHLDGYFWGYDGATFTMWRRYNGTDYKTPISSANIDKLDGTGPSGMTIDPTKGNVYRIQYQWLGYGAVVFSVENPETGYFTEVHRIEFANANTETSILNTSLELHVRAENTTNTTDITVRTPSMSVYRQGERNFVGPINSIVNTKTGVTTTLTNIVTIRNKSTYQSKTNNVPIMMEHFAMAVDGTKPAILSLWLNPTVGGTPSWTDIGTNRSVVEYDTAGTTVTGGNRIMTLPVGKSESKSQALRFLNWELAPGDRLVVAARATSSTTDATASITWRELF